MPDSFGPRDSHHQWLAAYHEETCRAQHSLHTRKTAPRHTPADLGTQATTEIAAALTGLLADIFALYLKTKNFHWHMSGPHFRDYHLMLDKQAEQIFAMTDALAERVRKVGGTTLRSIGQVTRIQRLLDNDAEYVAAQDMLAKLAEDNRTLAGFLRAAHTVCDVYSDTASTSLIEVWIDETECRNFRRCGQPTRANAPARRSSMVQSVCASSSTLASPAAARLSIARASVAPNKSATVACSPIWTETQGSTNLQFAGNRLTLIRNEAEQCALADAVSANQSGPLETKADTSRRKE